MLTITLLALIVLAAGLAITAPGSEGRETVLLTAGLVTVVLVCVAVAMAAYSIALSDIAAHLNLGGSA